MTEAVYRRKIVRRLTIIATVMTVWAVLMSLPYLYGVYLYVAFWRAFNEWASTDTEKKQRDVACLIQPARQTADECEPGL